MQVTETSKCPLGIENLLSLNCIGSRCRYYKDSTCSKQAEPKQVPVKFGLTKRVKLTNLNR